MGGLWEASPPHQGVVEGGENRVSGRPVPEEVFGIYGLIECIFQE